MGQKVFQQGGETVFPPGKSCLNSKVCGERCPPHCEEVTAFQTPVQSPQPYTLIKQLQSTLPPSTGALGIWLHLKFCALALYECVCNLLLFTARYSVDNFLSSSVCESLATPSNSLYFLQFLCSLHFPFLDIRFSPATFQLTFQCGFSIF